ncbi:TIGR00730 family Rossman fold protein [Terasakiella sp. A23]|uniref:LOG family protein n=1 Tax=Terasakiella sp. FCG-A23 TaxID=3080561 RepID=UPI002953C140|nr:TIGR00730 family Rossman fold protein [Terasakiella sp. A23]MDV7339261.1 TIGR00730 family Rossman fold protein [Terasakiella sp. A23]
MSFKPKSLCVFCGSRVGNDPTFVEEAKKLAKRMAEEGIEFVYGGGSIGIMGTLAEEILANGGRVTGVIPEFLQKLEVGHHGLTELIITDSMHDRKRTMFERSDGFIVLPGGLGTLDETFEIMTWKQLRLHDKPIIVLDCKDYWKPFENLVNATVEGGFAHEGVKDLYQMVKSADEVFDSFKEIPEVKQEVLTSHL